MYSLVVFNSLDEFIEINDLSKLEKYNNLNETNLADIFCFTCDFTDESSLLNWLLAFKFIPLSFSNGTIKIVKYNDNLTKFEQTNYSVPYMKDRKFFSIENLCNYFNRHGKDIDFLECFLLKFGSLKKYQPFYTIITKIENAYNSMIKNNTQCADEINFLLEKFVLIYIRFNSVTKKLDYDYEYDSMKQFARICELSMLVINFNNIHPEELLQIEDKYNEVDIEKGQKQIKEMLDNIMIRLNLAPKKLNQENDTHTKSDKIKNIKLMLSHYGVLLNKCILDEEKEAYLCEINALKRKLGELK